MNNARLHMVYNNGKQLVLDIVHLMQNVIIVAASSLAMIWHELEPRFVFISKCSVYVCLWVHVYCFLVLTIMRTPIYCIGTHITRKWKHTLALTHIPHSHVQMREKIPLALSFQSNTISYFGFA